VLSASAACEILALSDDFGIVHLATRKSGKTDTHFQAPSGKYIWLQPVAPNSPFLFGGDHLINVGKFVEGVLDKPEVSLPGKTAVLFTEAMSFGDFHKLLGKVTGRQTEYIQIPMEQYDQLFPNWGKEMGMMLQFFEEAAKEGWGAGAEMVTAQDLGVQGLHDAARAFKRIKW
jgi:hypothetical protein